VRGSLQWDEHEDAVFYIEREFKVANVAAVDGGDAGFSSPASSLTRLPHAGHVHGIG